VGSRRTPSVDDLDGTEALAILRQLWSEGGEFREAVRDRIEALLAEVDPDGVADAVFADLDGIAVEERCPKWPGVRLQGRGRMDGGEA